MKTQIIDNLARGVVLAGLLMFGLRGVLPDIVANEDFAAWVASGAAVILGFAAGQYAYRCPPACDPKVCRIG